MAEQKVGGGGHAPVLEVLVKVSQVVDELAGDREVIGIAVQRAEVPMPSAAETDGRRANFEDAADLRVHLDVSGLQTSRPSLQTVGAKDPVKRGRKTGAVEPPEAFVREVPCEGSFRLDEQQVARRK